MIRSPERNCRSLYNRRERCLHKDNGSGQRGDNNRRDILSEQHAGAAVAAEQEKFDLTALDLTGKLKGGEEQEKQSDDA